MTKEQFDELIHEVIPQQLFHIDPKDRDDESGGQLDEVILVGLIAQDPTCLKHKPLQWFIDTFLMEKNFEAELEDQERQSYDDSLQVEQDREERELFKQIQEDERENENTI